MKAPFTRSKDTDWSQPSKQDITQDNNGGNDGVGKEAEANPALRGFCYLKSVVCNLLLRSEVEKGMKNTLPICGASVPISIALIKHNYQGPEYINGLCNLQYNSPTTGLVALVSGQFWLLLYNNNTEHSCRCRKSVFSCIFQNLAVQRTRKTIQQSGLVLSFLLAVLHRKEYRIFWAKRQ